MKCVTCLFVCISHCLLGASPFWLTVAHHVSLALIGSANAFVWGRSKTFRSIATSYRILIEEDKHPSDDLLSSQLENAAY